LEEPGIALQVEKMLGGMSDLKREHYRQTQSSLSTVSATTPTYANTYTMLDYNPLHPTPFPDLWQQQQVEVQHRQHEAAPGNGGADAPMANLPTHDVLQLNGWQVAGVAWAFANTLCAASRSEYGRTACCHPVWERAGTYSYEEVLLAECPAHTVPS
jgi:hypothetical protein